MRSGAPAEPGDPLMIVVGGDALALSTAAELSAQRGHRVVVLWQADAEFGRAVEAAGAALIAASPESAAGLARAGVREAVAIVALSHDDRLNLHAALQARDANPRIRIVLRQFNRTLARKIEQNLPDCSVLSLAWHSAATYAAAALDPGCFRGLQFPEPDGPLTGFTTRLAERELAGHTAEEVERALAARLIAVDGDTGFARDQPLPPRARLTLFGEIARLEASLPRRPVAPPPRPARRLRRLWRGVRRLPRRLDPIISGIATAALAVLLVGSWFFRHALGLGWLTSIYFVVTTMTTTGFGDLHPEHDDPLQVAAATLLMLCGLVFSGVFIGFAASLLTRWQWVSMQGLRPVRRRGHIIVCGAGSIGTNVIDLLLELGKELVVIEVSPDASLIERARERRFDLLTGDASRDATLDLCNLAAAHGLVALTNVDTLNLEIALGGRARNPTIPIVLRIADASFAASIARHFEFATTFSAAALAAPAFAGLARLAGSRGRVTIPGASPGPGAEFAIAEFDADAPAGRALPAGAIPLAVAEADEFALVGEGDAVAAGERLLALLPVAPQRAGAPLAAAVEPVPDS